MSDQEARTAEAETAQQEELIQEAQTLLASMRSRDAECENLPGLICEAGESTPESRGASDDTSDGEQGKLPRYWPSRTVEEWREYHRIYYRDHAERRRQQAAASHQRQRIRRDFGDLIPRSLLRRLLRE